MRNLVGVGVLVICLLCLSPSSSRAQPGSHLLNRVVSQVRLILLLQSNMCPQAGQTSYPSYIPMKVLRGFKRQVSLADRGMMMGLGKRGVIGDRGESYRLQRGSSECSVPLSRYDDGARQEEQRPLGGLSL